jgi:hypothetical protein
METKINKEKLNLIRRIRQHTLFYSIATLNRMYTVNLRTLAILCDEGVL